MLRKTNIYQCIFPIIMVIFIFQDIAAADIAAFSCLRKPMILWENDNDFFRLAGQEAVQLARDIKDIVEEVHFDEINRLLRKENYSIYPFPGSEHIVNKEALLNSIVENRENSPLFTQRAFIAFKFFMFAESISIEELEILFGSVHGSAIKDGFKLGLFIQKPDGTVKMNGLSLFSLKISEDKVIYLFTDTPYFLDLTASSEDAYVGNDSYNLLYRILKIDNISGVCIEIGTGSGIQLIGLASKFQSIKTAGVEIVARARHLSQFNAAINGVEDRVNIVSDVKELQVVLGGEKASLAVLNPPFVALPEFIETSDADSKALKGIASVVRQDSRIKVDLKSIFPVSSWGGADGLVITKEFIDKVMPFLDEKGQIFIFSLFAGDREGPSKMFDYIKKMHPGMVADFEPEKPIVQWSRSEAGIIVRSHEGVVRSAEELADGVSGGLLMRLTKKLYQQGHKPGDKAMEAVIHIASKWKGIIATEYRESGITHFHPGIFILAKKESKEELLITQAEYDMVKEFAGLIEQEARRLGQEPGDIISARKIERLAGNKGIKLTRPAEEIADLVEKMIYGRLEVLIISNAASKDL